MFLFTVIVVIGRVCCAFLLTARGWLLLLFVMCVLLCVVCVLLVVVWCSSLYVVVSSLIALVVYSRCFFLVAHWLAFVVC